MPTIERVPTDLVADDLVRTYSRGAARLNALVTDALRRGLNPSRAYTPDARRGDATAAYRQRQLAAANAVLEDLRRQGARLAPVAVTRAYASAAVAVDNVLKGADVARPELVGQFGGLHQRAIQVMAANLERTLTRAVDRAGENLRTVFDRADAVEGALDPRTSAAPGVPFIGRRQDDPYRRVALEVLGERTVSLETRRQISDALARRLVTEGATDAVTGFVDRAGRRWSLDSYATMVTRTTTREATSRATIGRLTEHGHDLVTISSHPHASDECDGYDGETFSISGQDADYPVLDVMPPFHPNCVHVVTPAATGLEDFERELGLRAERSARPPRPFRAPRSTTPPPVRAPRNVPTNVKPPGETRATGELTTPTTPAAPPLSRLARPTRDAGTPDRLAAERSIDDLIALDPGPEHGATAARFAAAERDARADVRSLNVAIGPEGVAFLKRQSSVTSDLRGQMLRGELSRGDLEGLMYEDWAEREHRRAHREERANHKTDAFPCFVCGRFKHRPADVCQYCGDDPVSYTAGARGGHDTAELERFNRNYGYDY